MELLSYRNPDNQVIEIGYGGDYQLHEWYGMGASEVLPVTARGYRQQGYTYQGATLGMRIITVNIRYVGEYYRHKDMIDRTFNPLLGPGVLTYTNDFTSRSITVLPTLPATPLTRDGYHVVTVELTAYDPFFYDPAENALKLGDYRGGLTFPMKFDPSIRFAQKGDMANIEIVGDVESPLRAEFRGPAVKPKLTNVTTGEFIEVDATLAAGDTLWINTAYGNKTVIIHRADGTEENAYNLITVDSSFMQLQRGQNRLEFTSEGSGDAGTEVYLYWRNRYIGA